jgi:hypothetical protein
MSTNYDVSGIDLINIFQPYYSVQANTTGYTVNNSDLNTYFEKIGGGEIASTSSYQVNESDLNTIFAGKTFTVSGTYKQTVNTNSGTKYIVICFGKTSSNVSTISTISFTAAPTTVNYWIVGGGGGGGGTSSAYTIGAGGGGGGSILSGTFSPSINTTYTINVGAGGNGGGNAAKDGASGTSSSIIGGSVTKTASGGNGGECAANGSTKGAAGTYNGTTSIGAGGNGAKNSNSYYPGNGDSGTSIAISIPGYSTYYSGGGGGGANSYYTFPYDWTIGGTGGSDVGGHGGDYTDLGFGAGNGTILTGGGGGGAAQPYPASTSGLTRGGGDGGSGVVYMWFTYY